MPRQPTNHFPQLIILILQAIHIVCKFHIFTACTSQVEQEVGIGSFNIASSETVKHASHQSFHAK
jgi:hypothetical protein